MISRVYQFHRNLHTVPIQPNTSIDNAADTQISNHLVDASAAVFLGSLAAKQPQARNLGQLSLDLFRHASREIGLSIVRRQVAQIANRDQRRQWRTLSSRYLPEHPDRDE
jgi:hypothetical protein